MKYKRLSANELKSLEADFVKFLASNTVTADDWVKIKKNDAAKAVELIDLFSDIVVEKALAQTKYLELRTPHQVQVIYCGKEQMNLLGIYVSQDSQVDFTAFSGVIELLKFAAKDSTVKVISGAKKYQKERNMEIYSEIERGFKIAPNSTLFDGLKLLIK